MIKWAASWSGGGSSLYLFSALTALFTLYIMRRGATYKFTAAMTSILLASMVAALLNGAFDIMEGGGGIGINPLLKSYWILVHPPTTFLGYSMLLTASIAMLSGIRAIKLFLAGWIFLTLGITLGGYWSYETFGWGGYWAWDPVEISQLTVWLAAVAVIHSIGPLSGLRKPMLLLLASSIPLALYVTRSGLSPLHSFAAANIGTAILLGISIVILGIMLYIVATDEKVYTVTNTVLSTIRRRNIPAIGITISGTLLILIALFVYASLLAPSILTAIGMDATVPTMSEGVRFYHPILFPLFTTALAIIPIYFLSKELKVKGILAYSIIIIISTLLSIVIGTRYKIAPLSSTNTNIMMAMGLTISLIVLGMLITSIIISRSRRGRDTVLKIIHIGMTITFIGVLLSGTYAFNDVYLEKYNIRKGESINIGNINIKVLNYIYEINNGTIDLDTHITGKRVTALAAWQGISTLEKDMAPLVKEVLLAQEEVTKNKTLTTIEDIIKNINNNMVKDSIYISDIGSISMITVNETIEMVNNDTISVLITDPSITISIESGQQNITQNSTERYSYISLIINGSNISVKSDNLAKNNYDIVNNVYYKIRFDRGTPIIIGGIEIGIIEIIVFGSEVNISGNKLVVSNPIMLVSKGIIKYNDINIDIPGKYDYGLYLYSIAKFRQTGVLSKVVDSTLADVLLDPGLLYSISSEGPGMLPLPSEVLDGVRLKVKLEVDMNGKSIIKESVVRFEANGEALGIHGLVTDTIVIKDGLNDLYINVRPPQVDGFFGVYHELLPYYLKEARNGLSEAEYVSLVAVMAAGHVVGGAGSLDPSVGIQVERGMIDLYLLADSFSPSNSTINTDGLTIAVKVVPGVNLIWIGVAVMVAGGISALILYSLAYTKTARKQG